MKPAAFNYHQPKSVDEALAIYAACEDARFLAGGQSLVPMMSLRLATPTDLIDLNKIEQLSGISSSDGYIRIGAMTRQEELGVNRPLCTQVPVMRAIIDSVGHPGTRTRGTIGGSLCHADPAAELPALLLTLDAELLITQQDGTTRSIPVEDFFRGHFETALRPDEILIEIRIPIAARRHMGFNEITARSSDFAMAGAIASAHPENDGTFSSIRIVTFALRDRPQRLREVESAVTDAQGDVASIRLAAQLTEGLISPREEVHLSTAYRRRLAVTVVRRALESAVGHLSEVNL
ncbi:MAG: xanthine dehydrogenase family protein subunit M [Actinomycetota bacterium]|nr:xanthine dehydrogenase family protein subunit M [Actinomycetota bacterium]